MSEWITDRLPIKQEAVSGNVICCRWGHINLLQWYKIEAGEPWMPIPKPDMYVKPKRWITRWDVHAHRWYIVGSLDRYIVASLELEKNQADVAQRIADIYNEVMP